MSGVLSSVKDVKEEDISSSNVEIVIESIKGTRGIMINNGKTLTVKNDDNKTQYYLNVEQIAEVHEGAQFLTIQGECADGNTEQQQYVAVQMDGSDQIILQDKDIVIELCRICANGSDRFVPIFNGEGLEHDLQNKIQTYLPLQISEDDSLPLQVCYNCAETLLAWHEIHKGCLNAQDRLVDLQNKFNFKTQCVQDSLVEEDDVIEDEEVLNSEEPEAQSSDTMKEESIQAVDMPESDRGERGYLSREQGQEAIYECGVCDKLYGEELELLSHMSSNHRVDKEFHYECVWCSKPYASRASLERHLRLHEQQRAEGGEDARVGAAQLFERGQRLYQCSECGRVMTHRPSFVRHMRVHLQERPAMCERCGKRFRTNEDVRRHTQLVHLKIRSHPCDLCSMSFSSKTALDSHTRVHTQQRPFPCTVCPKRFRSRPQLAAHAATHMDLRPFPCPFDGCPRAFRAKQHLQAHLPLHTGIRPFSCQHCAKLFTTKGELSRHALLHEQIKPFLCSDCGKTFRMKRYLKTHITAHHPENATLLLAQLHTQNS